MRDFGYGVAEHDHNTSSSVTTLLLSGCVGYEHAVNSHGDERTVHDFNFNSTNNNFSLYLGNPHHGDTTHKDSNNTSKGHSPNAASSLIK